MYACYPNLPWDGVNCRMNKPPLGIGADDVDPIQPETQDCLGSRLGPDGLGQMAQFQSDSELRVRENHEANFRYPASCFVCGRPSDGLCPSRGKR